MESIVEEWPGSKRAVLVASGKGLFASEIALVGGLSIIKVEIFLCTSAEPRGQRFFLFHGFSGHPLLTL